MKTVLVSGGSRGIGKAIVERFHSAGYRVIFLYKISTDKALKLTKAYSNVFAYQCDVSDEDSVNSTLNEILSSYEQIDVLVNNVGVSFEGLLTDMSLNEWKFVIDNNLTSVFLLSKAVIPHFVSRKRGKIINISSMWGDTGASCEVAYSASKGGINAFTKALAKELAPSGITVNAVSPGVIDTDMMADFSEEDINELCNQTPLGRIGKGIDVANAVMFLAEESGDFITGQIFNVNGGFLI